MLLCMKQFFSDSNMINRRYENLLRQHFSEDNQMAFISGPRQVGKTTSCRSFQKKHHYFNWDNDEHRLLILQSQSAVANQINIADSRTVIFDELHKYPQWKNFLKGFYDSYGAGRLNIIVTGSGRLDIYKKGADSLMGRYFHYRMHPLSVAEILSTSFTEQLIRPPSRVDRKEFDNLLIFGGFPEPFIKHNTRFYNRWKKTRFQLLFREDLRDTSKIYEIGQVEILAEILRQQAGQLSNFSSISRKIRSSQDSIRRWIATLESLYYCFSIRPWTKNVPRSLIKEPKIYLWDWSTVPDKGARNENFIASHLLKAVHWWNDIGLGNFGLYFLRTREQKEVDFIVTKEQRPWFLVEVKSSPQRSVNKELHYFYERLQPEHSFQVALDMDYSSFDCFQENKPVQVPASTFLSQLI